MEIGGRICPFRSTNTVNVYCESTCQLFRPQPGHKPELGLCAFTEININLMGLLQHMGNLGRLIGAQKS